MSRTFFVYINPVPTPREPAQPLPPATPPYDPVAAAELYKARLRDQHDGLNWHDYGVMERAGYHPG